MQNYQVQHILGQGTFGRVSLAVDKETEQKVAIKQQYFSETKNCSNVIKSCALFEAYLLKRLDHPNVVKYVGEHETWRGFNLVLEYVEDNLENHVRKLREKVSRKDLKAISSIPYQQEIKNLLFQLLNGVAYMHSVGVMHRDLKPENILIDAAGALKICDFGLAGFYEVLEEFSTNVVTLRYRAPDILLGNQFYDYSIDIWSVGCVFAEMLRGKPLFKARTEKDLLLLILEYAALLYFINISFKSLIKIDEETTVGFVKRLPPSDMKKQYFTKLKTLRRRNLQGSSNLESRFPALDNQALDLLEVDSSCDFAQIVSIENVAI